MQDSEEKETNTDEVQTEYKRIKRKFRRGSFMFVSCERCVLPGKGLCVGPITCQGESYRLRCVIVCDLDSSRMRRPWSVLGCFAVEKMKFTNTLKQLIFGVEAPCL
jgi:coenzyme F420-reducing hydrogenase gamma subunit